MRWCIGPSAARGRGVNALPPQSLKSPLRRGPVAQLLEIDVGVARVVVNEPTVMPCKLAKSSASCRSATSSAAGCNTVTTSAVMATLLSPFAGHALRWNRCANRPAPHAWRFHDRSGIVPHVGVQSRELSPNRTYPVVITADAEHSHRLTRARHGQGLNSLGQATGFARRMSAPHCTRALDDLSGLFLLSSLRHPPVNLSDQALGVITVIQCGGKREGER